jgi:hypothetical protein
MKNELLAPNGKPTNLTAEQYKLVRTDAFKNWFGNWETDPKNASKVVDENGEPLVVYHSSKNEFNIFEKEKISENFDYSFGFYFSNDIEDSKEYGKITKSFFLNIKNPYVFYVDDNSNGSVFIDVNRYEVINEIVKSRKTAIEIDGVIAYSYTNGYVAMYSNQIKLADGGNSTFDSNNPDIRFEKGGLIAPNGKPSNLTPKQYKLVRTPAFLNWFGNWENDPENASKVIDDNGEPLVVYHGTKSKFTEFDLNLIAGNTGNYGHYGYGFYFSDDAREAKTYGNIIVTCFLNFRNPFIWTKKNIILLKENGVYWIDDLEEIGFEKDDLIQKLSKVNYPASELLRLIYENGYEEGWREWLKKYNPNDYSIDFNDVASLLDDSQIEYNKEYLESIGVTGVKTIKDFPYEQSLHWITELGERSKEVTDIVYSLGFDSIVYGSEYIAFEPNQIKLADGTNTTFDSSNDDIRFEQGGETKFTTPDYLVMFLGR